MGLNISDLGKVNPQMPQYFKVVFHVNKIGKSDLTKKHYSYCDKTINSFEYDYVKKLVRLEFMQTEEGLIDDVIIYFNENKIEKMIFYPNYCINEDNPDKTYKIIGTNGNLIDHLCKYDISRNDIVTHTIVIQYDKLFKAVDWIDNIKLGGVCEVDND